MPCFNSPLPLLFWLCFLATGISQTHHRCHWKEIQREMQQRPQHAMYQLPGQPLIQTRSSMGVVTIPVVFHIIHDGKSVGQGENVSTSLLLSQIDQLNDDFRRQNADKHLTPGLFLSDAADVEIEFCLAAQDPDGFPTNGIKRYNFGLPDYSPEELKHVVQSKTTWDRDQYLNIWVADVRGYLGYAYLPGGAALGDGLVVDYITVGALNNPNPFPSPFKYGRTATHEIGHWLGLYHHWATPNDCFADDGIADTPKQYSYYSGSPVHPQSSCNSTDMFMNFLDYVDDDAMNLFTKGQKNVMQLSLSGLRSGLLSSPGCQAVQPVIMFEQTNLATLEGTANCFSGQQKYVEVTMKIAKGPSRTATATLQSSGSAIEGQDFTFSPQRVTFPAGSTSPRTFKVVIHEDAYLENVKDIMISYQLSTGGGNARKGSNKQTCKIQLIDDDFEAQPFEMMQETIGHHMGSNTTASPFQGGHSDGRMQTLYDVDEMKNMGLEAGWIESLTYFITQKRSTQTYRNFSVKMTLTSLDQFPEYPFFYPGLQEVYNGDLFAVAGAMKINLDQAFYWDGYSNLMIETCYDNSSSSNHDAVKYENTGSQNPTVISEFGPGGSGCSYNFMPNRHSLRPLIELELAHGHHVAVDLNSGGGFVECELGPYEKIYVYDEQNNDVMMSIENLDNHDYGCTKIEIDREGLGSSRLWGSAYDATPKTFKVLPEFNHGGGWNRIQLYYSQQEIESWEQSNSRGYDKTQLRFIKCNQAISASVNSDCRSIQCLLEPYGSDYVFTATTKDGFSGFSLSNWPGGGFLAITDIRLGGRTINDAVELQIETTGELIDEEFIWFKKRDGDITWTAFFPKKSLDQKIWVDENPIPGNSLYRVQTSNGVKSNIISIEYLSDWKFVVKSSEIRIQNNEVAGFFDIYTIRGIHVARQYLEANASFGWTRTMNSPQVLFIHKSGESKQAIKKVVF